MFITSEIRGDAETAVQIGLTRGKASVSNPHTTKNIICQRVSYYVMVSSGRRRFLVLMLLALIRSSPLLILFQRKPFSVVPRIVFRGTCKASEVDDRKTRDEKRVRRDERESGHRAMP
jgi:hypothetical protein